LFDLGRYKQINILKQYDLLLYLYVQPENSCLTYTSVKQISGILHVFHRSICNDYECTISKDN
jgi:hypothetical protein